MTRTTPTDRHGQRGVVMVITLLSVLLLVALVLFVMNLGQQVERRIAMQNAADATAAAGSVWVSRTMNTVARNNIEMTRMIGLVNVLDALPRSTAYALQEQSAFHEALEMQLGRGVSNTGPTVLRALLEEELTDFRDELDAEIEQLEAADAFFADHDTTELTWYDGPRGMGAFWRALYAMDEVNQAALEALGRSAQIAATDGGAMTISHAPDAAAFMVPVTPDLPWQRGRFDDFERPVKHGLLPASVDDPHANRGPYDTVFGWHHTVGRVVGGTWIPGSSQTADGGRGGVPIGRASGGGSGGRHVGASHVVTGYRVWGMHDHLLRRVGDFTVDRLRNTRLATWTRRMADAKLAYLWPGDDAQPDDEQLARTLAPEWITDWSQAIAIAANEPDRIVETGFIAFELKSRHPIHDPRFLSDGSWAPIDDEGRWQPRLVRAEDWHDPRDWPAAQVAQHGWRDTWDYTVWFDHEIGIAPRTDAAGQPLAQTVYRIDHFYFVGVNVGEAEDILDPYAGFNPDSTDAPAPSDLNHTMVRPGDEASRRAHLTFLAVAKRNDDAQAWPSAFRGQKPYAAVVGLAQAKVFNNHSWDLWTPMWHARLEPVSDLDRWAHAMRDHQADLADARNIDEQRYVDLESYLTRTAGLADVMLGH